MENITGDQDLSPPEEGWGGGGRGGGKKLLLLRTFLCEIAVPGTRACAVETGWLLREKQKKRACNNNNQWQN